MAHRNDTADTPVQFEDPDDYARMRELLHAAGFMDPRLPESLGIPRAPAAEEGDLHLILRRTGSGSPLHTLVRLFMMGRPVAAEHLKRAIHPMSVDGWRRAGLVSADGPEVSASVRLLPFQGLALAFDRPELLGTPLGSNYVMGIGGSTLTLATLTIRERSRRTLDLGTGCGVHAVLAAAHSDEVTAADLNPRAVGMARFNARLNGAAGVACVQGDLFAPVGGRRFDLVVSNPPFVISPENHFVYRDGGMASDGLTRRIVREAPRHLNPGGFCQILCNWAQEAGRDWPERLSAWVAGTGCDAWVMRSETMTAEAYAAKWIRHTEHGDGEAAAAERYDRWVDYYDRLGIASIGSGLITLRRSDGGPNWFRADESPEKMEGPSGGHVARGFALMDFLERAAGDETLLDACLRCAPDLRLEERYAPSPEGWKTVGSVIRLTEGLAYRGNADALMANLIVCCDGRTPLRALVAGLADASGVAVDRIAPNLCPIIRKLVERGFLLPAGMPGG